MPQVPAAAAARAAAAVVAAEEEAAVVAAAAVAAAAGVWGMTASSFTAIPLGLGVGWRAELALPIDRERRLGFVELLAEEFDPDGPFPAAIERLRERGTRIVLHGVGLSLGVPDDRSLGGWTCWRVWRIGWAPR